MAIDAKFTRTLPAPTATISSGFVFLLSAGWFTDADLGAAGDPIGGGANSIANGGGDMQIFSDTGTTTRLPIEVVTFVTGGSPDAQVWVRTPSYTSGDTITIGRDDTQTTQPAVGAAFGRNATWVDSVSAYLFNSSAVDSTGNYDGTVVGASLQAGGGYEFTGTNRIEIPTGLNDDINNDVNILILFTDNNTTNDGHAFDTTVGSSDGYDMRYVSGDRSIEVSEGGTSFTINTSITTTSTDHFWVMDYNGSDMFELYDGVKSSVVASATSPVDGSTQPKNRKPSKRRQPFWCWQGH